MTPETAAGRTTDEWSVTTYRCVCHNVRWNIHPNDSTIWVARDYLNGIYAGDVETFDDLTEKHNLHPIGVDNVAAEVNDDDVRDRLGNALKPPSGSSASSRSRHLPSLRGAIMTTRPSAAEGSPLSGIVAENIWARRGLRGETRHQLSAALARIGKTISGPAIGNIETGRPDEHGVRRRQVSVDELAAFAELFEVEPWSLTVPFVCTTCDGNPPPGFMCRICGRTSDDE